MAVGDTIGNEYTVTTGNYCDIQPGAGVEWLINNIYYAGTVEFYKYNGSLTVKFDASTTYGAKECFMYRCTNTNYVRVKNTSAGDLVIGYDGIVWK